MSDVEQAATPEATTDGPPAEAKNTDTPGPVPFHRFKEVTDQLAELRDWKKEQEQAATERKKEADKAERERLKQQEEWQKLAEQHEARVAELEPLAERVTRYEGVITALLEKQREGVPEFVQPLLDKLDPADQLEYIAANQEKWGKPAPPNVNDTRGGSGKAHTEADKQQLAAMYGVDPSYLP